ncbi:ABC transporter permease [Brevibacillus migulae]|uniref:ABC transporter permease n=1 Tax=Brevibacillus migulae TaxID=1644114 RepID=UPI00106E3448|nr:FtsX-like permease family protein [Brevibacillus migulae]
MMGVRWRKVIRDIFENKAKFLLVVLSIAIGVVAVGNLELSKYKSVVGLQESYMAAAPSSATLLTTPFDESLLAELKRMPAIREAEGRAVATGRISAGTRNGQYSAANSGRDLQLFSLKDYSTIRMDKIYPKAGSWPPAGDGLYLDQTSLDYLGLSLGDPVFVELANGKTANLRIAGVIDDPGRMSAQMSGKVSAYVFWGMLTMLEIPPDYNALHFTVKNNQADLRQIEKVTTQVKARLQQKNIRVLSTYIPEPGKHWGYDIMDSTFTIFIYLGWLALLMGAALVFNSVLAILTGQIRQSGVMQVLGAQTKDLVKLNLAFILVFCLCGLAIGIPLAEWASSWVMSFSASIGNFSNPGDVFSLRVRAIELAAGLLIPMLAAMYPIAKGTRITIREAINDHRRGNEFGESRVDRIVERVHWFSRPVLLSIRNTFRQKFRLFLTILTLSVGGAIVISSYCIYSSINYTVERSMNYAQYDIRMELARPFDEQEAIHLAKEVPGVVKAEGWWEKSVNRVRADRTEGEDMKILTLPADSRFITPTIVKGRWLTPQDENALVVDTFLLRKEPDIDIGDTVLLKIGEEIRPFQVVGFARKVLGDTESYVNDKALPQMEGNEATINLLHIVTAQHDSAFQAKTSERLLAHFKEKGIEVGSVTSQNELREHLVSRFDLIQSYLISTGVLLTIMAVIGLIGTMSINIMERTREFGILRSIGASDAAVFRIVMVEGVVIGLISWVFAVGLSLPISKQLSNQIGVSLTQTPLDYLFPVEGVFLWLAVTVVLSVLASLLPAWTASRLSIKDVLQYE